MLLHRYYSMFTPCIFKQKWGHSFASPSLPLRSTSHHRFPFEVQWKLKLFDAIEACLFPLSPFTAKPLHQVTKPLQITPPLDAISYLVRSAASITKGLSYIPFLPVDTSSWFQVAAHLRDNIIHQTYQARPIMQIPPKFISEEKEDWLQRFTICTDSDLGGHHLHC